MTKSFKEFKIQLSKNYRVGHLSNHVNNCKSGFAVEQNRSLVLKNSNVD